MSEAVFPVIDLFAGPGGLSEGFASFRDPDGKNRFKICLSIEKDATAHRTLRLRSFFRLLSETGDLEDYWEYLRGKISGESLFERHPREAAKADIETWCFQLGRRPQEVDERILSALGPRPGPWLLIGGPPCQAYSLAGRARYRDARTSWRKQRLYENYLRVIAKFRPTAFVMENVKGLLSSRAKSGSMFEKIREDLANPQLAIDNHRDGTSLQLTANGNSNGTVGSEYRIYSFVATSLFPDGQEFVIRAEDYGVPQRRHRVILVGVRADVQGGPQRLVPQREVIKIKDVLYGLPALRSRLSKDADSAAAWVGALSEGLRCGVFDDADEGTLRLIRASISQSKRSVEVGARFVPAEDPPRKLAAELFRVQLGGIPNHESRGHIKEDLWRYLFASCYAVQHRRSPTLQDFPRKLLPKHRSVVQALRRSSGHFSDRFRVQLADIPATTITAHIAKDGHYFIHFDPSQCRSLTVREAARLQTFPDDYFFEGGKTQQYMQVGNAVPPLLARQLAGSVCPVLEKAENHDKKSLGTRSVGSVNG